MSFSSYLNTTFVNSLPDWTTLGGRAFFVDGRNPNVVHDGYAINDRIMGCFPQQEISYVTAAAGGNLEANTAYVYGVQRIVKKGALEIPSSVTLLNYISPVYMMTCGAAGTSAPATWAAIANGNFAINGVDVAGVDFSGITTMAEVASVITAAVRTALGSTTDTVSWSTDRFVFTGEDHAFTVLSQISAPVPTDISGSSYMNGLTGTAVVATNMNTIVELRQYEFLPEDGAGWDIYYRVYRSKDGATGLLYRVGSDYTQAQFKALTSKSITAFADGGGGTVTLTATAHGMAVGDLISIEGTTNYNGDYIITAKTADTITFAATWVSDDGTGTVWNHIASFVDSVSDDSLDATETVSTATEDPNQFLYPARCIRTYRNHLVAGGSFAYREGSVDVIAGALDVVIVNSPGQVFASDVGAYVAIEGEPEPFVVSLVDVLNQKLTLASSVSAAKDDASWILYRDQNALFVCTAQPGNIEGYGVGGELISGSGGGDAIRGIAVNNHCYILRQRLVEILDGSTGAWSLLPHPTSPPGCASHATIADRYSPGFVIYYAGHAVVMLRGYEHIILSEPIRQILEDEVDHSMDSWTHGVYDPSSGLYWLWLFDSDWADAGIQVPQMVLIYDTIREQWYKGELAARRSDVWRDHNGQLVAVVGVGGGVAKLDSGYVDGSYHAGTVTSATASTITDTAASFRTVGNGCAGCPIHVYHADGTMERRIVKSNTTTQVAIYGEWDVTPDDAATYKVGSIRWSIETGDITYASGSHQRRKIARVAIGFDPDPDGSTNQMTLTASGRRADTEKVASAMVDMADIESYPLSGSRAGLRLRGVKVKANGDGARPVTLNTIMVRSQEKVGR